MSRPAPGWRPRCASPGLWDGPGSPDLYELDLARKLREALRLLLLSHNGGPALAPGELEPLHAVSATPLCVDIGPGGTMTLRATQGGRLEVQLARLLLAVRDAQLLGTWPRLKACRNPQCRWAFYDRSGSQQGAWCEMRVCGNRAKNRRFRQRAKPGG